MPSSPPGGQKVKPRLIRLGGRRDWPDPLLSPLVPCANPLPSGARLFLPFYANGSTSVVLQTVLQRATPATLSAETLAPVPFPHPSQAACKRFPVPSHHQNHPHLLAASNFIAPGRNQTILSPYTPYALHLSSFSLLPPLVDSTYPTFYTWPFTQSPLSHTPSARDNLSHCLLALPPSTTQRHFYCLNTLVCIIELHY